MDVAGKQELSYSREHPSTHYSTTRRSIHVRTD